MKGFKKRTEKHMRQTNGFEKQNQKHMRQRGLCRQTKHATKSTGGQENGLEKQQENTRGQGEGAGREQKEETRNKSTCGHEGGSEKQTERHMRPRLRKGYDRETKRKTPAAKSMSTSLIPSLHSSPLHLHPPHRSSSLLASPRISSLHPLLSPR